MLSRTVGALLLAAGAWAAHAQPADPRTALGLVVKLKDGSIATLNAGGGPEQPAAATARRERLDRLLTDARIVPRGVQPVGPRAHWVDFGRPMPAAEAERVAEQLRARPDVAWVVPNVREKLLAVPNDPAFLSRAQWWLLPPSGSNQNVLTDRLRGVPDFQTAWDRSTGSPNAVVAVLDTGITAHPALAGKVLPGYDFVSDVDHAADGNGRDADPTDPGDGLTPAEAQLPVFSGCGAANSTWHGTSIAGMLAAATNDATSVAAINWNGRVLPVRVAGKCGAAVADIVAGMRWAAGIHQDGVPDNPNPARIVNISFGGSAACNELYQETVDELAARGVVVVAAAGNEHQGVSRPASCRGVVGVAALNRDGFKATYSNFGPQIAISTVGGDEPTGGRWDDTLADSGLLTLSNSGRYTVSSANTAYMSGTSFSAPVVSGVLGLMLSVDPSLTATQLVAGLRASARPHVTSSRDGTCSNANPGRCICTTATCGVGIVDAAEALRYASAPAAYTAPNWAVVNVDSPELIAAVAAGPDRDANPAPASSGGGAWGGGATLGLALVAWAAGRRRREAEPG